MTYRNYRPHYNDVKIGELYAWQASLASAWHEVLGYAEVILRNAIDTGFAQWNTAYPPSPCGTDWLIDPAKPLRILLDPPAPVEGGNPKPKRRVLHNARMSALRNRPEGHPRHSSPITHDDLLAQLSFGELVHLLPSPEDQRTGKRQIRSKTGFTPRENMWRYGVKSGFPNIEAIFTKDGNVDEPNAIVNQGREVGDTADRLRKLRNRIAHYDQILTAEHEQRHRDVIRLVEAVSPNAAAALIDISRVLDLAKLEP